MSQGRIFNRRQHERFALPAMYTDVRAWPGRRKAHDASLAGHAYDISEGGARIELDEPLQAGADVEVEITLPGCAAAVCARGEVIWVSDAADDPGPRRLAVCFDAFDSDADRRRLIGYLGRSEYGLERAAA